MTKGHMKLTMQLFCVVIIGFILRLVEVRVRRPTKNHAKTEKYSVLDQELSGEPVSSIFEFPAEVSKPLEFTLGGCIFVDAPDECVETQHLMTTGLLHVLSPYLENQVRSKFVDPPGDNSFYVLSPALAIKGSNLKIYTRIMLDRLRYRYHQPKSFPVNQFKTNYIYTETFNTKMESTDQGEVLSIPSPSFPLEGDGPMDPRVFTIEGKLFLLALTFTNLGDLLWKPHPVIWDLERSKLFLPLVNLTYDPRNPMEKNWSPLVINRTLYLIQNLDPLRIVQCDLKRTGCKFVKDDSQKNEFKFERRKHLLRGGTPFVLYKWPYYISLAHSVVIYDKKGAPFNRTRRYEANLVVMRVFPNFRIVYVSDALHFNEELYRNVTMVYYKGQIKIENEFVYPVSVIIESSDSIAIGGHVNDRVSVLLRLTGVRRIMSDIAALNEVTVGSLDPLQVQNHVMRKFPLGQQ